MSRTATIADVRIGDVFRMIDETTKRVLIDVGAPSAQADPHGHLTEDGHVQIITRAQHARAFTVRLLVHPTRRVVIFS